MTTMTRPPELDAEAIYQALEQKKRSEQKRRGRRVSWRMVAVESMVSDTGATDVFTRLGQGRLPSPHNLFLILLWVGRTDLRAFEKAARS